MEAAEHMMRYLVGTKYRGIEFDGKRVETPYKTFVASSDASFADDPETRYSSNGFCFQLFGGMVHWKASSLQKNICGGFAYFQILTLRWKHL